jgi:hypothetical protein
LREPIRLNVVAQGNVLAAGRCPGLLESGFDAVGDEGESGASFLRDRLASVVGDDEDRHMEGRVVSPPAAPGLISPRALAAEHVPAHHGRSEVLERFLDHLAGSVHLATLLAVGLAPSRQPEGPLVKLHAALAQRVLLALVRPGNEAVQ